MRPAPRKAVLFPLLLLAAAAAWLGLRGGGGTDLGGPPVPDRTAAGGAAGAPRLATRPAAPEVPPAPEGGASLRGRVVDEHDRPAAGILVEASRGPDSGYFSRLYGLGGGEAVFAQASFGPDVWTRVASATTGADGRFTLEGLARHASYRVEARAAPPRVGTTSFMRVWLARGDTVLRVLPGSPLRGRVLDLAGSGRPAVVAASLRLPEPRNAVAWSDQVEAPEDGRFSWTAVPDGTVQLTATVPGEGSVSLRVPTPAAEEVVLRLGEPDGASVAGRVLDASKVGIGGARVRFEVAPLDGASGPIVTAIAATGEDGSFRVGPLATGRLTSAAAEAPGYVAFHARGMDAPAPARGILAYDFTLVRASAISGTVRDEAGRPLPGARLSLHGSLPGSMLVRTATSDAGGRFRFDGLPVAQATIESATEGRYLAGEGGALSVPVAVRKPGEDVERDVVLIPGIPLAGTVRDEHGPVAGAAVHTTHRASAPYRLTTPEGWPTALTDARGEFALPGLPPGIPWVLQAEDGDRASEPTAPMTLAAGLPPPRIDLVLRPTARVSGTVVGAGGEPIPPVRVHVHGRPAVAVPDDEGRFSILGLEPGEVLLEATAPNGIVLGSLPLTLDWGAVVEGVVVRVAETRAIRGTVVDEAGEPVARASLVLRSEEASAASVFAHTGADGSFEVRWLLPGTYRVRVGGREIPDLVEAGTSGARLVLPGGSGHLEILLLDPDGRPLPLADLAVHTGKRQGSTSGHRVEVRGGRHRIRRSSLAEYTALAVLKPRTADGTPLDLAAAFVDGVDPARSPLEIRLSPARRLEGRVVDEEGNGVGGVWVSARPVERESMGFLAVREGVGSGRSEPDGSFVVRHVPEGEVDLSAWSETTWLRHEQRVPRAVEHVVVRLVRGGSVSGRVVGPDGAVPGARVRVEDAWGTSSRSAATDEEGRFEVSGLAPDGAFDVTVRPPRGGELVSAQAAGVRAGSRHLVIELSRGVAVEGEVVGPDGRPAADAQVFIDDPPTFAPVQPGGTGTGRFRLFPLPPGRVRLHARVERGDDRAASDVVEVVAPASGVRVVLARGTTLEGRIVGPGTAGASVAWFPHTDGAWPEVAEDGSFRVPRVRDEVGTIWVGHPDGRCGLREGVRPSEGPFEVPIEEGFVVSGRLEAADPSAWARGSVRLRRGPLWIWAVPEADGRFRARSVPRGSYDLVFVPRGGRGEVPLAADVAAGTEGLVLRVPTR